MTTKITNEQIYELLKIQGRQLESLSGEIRDIRHDIREINQTLNRHDQRLGKLENQIDHIRISWSTRLVTGILGTSAITSGIVAYIITQLS